MVPVDNLASQVAVILETLVVSVMAKQLISNNRREPQVDRLLPSVWDRPMHMPVKLDSKHFIRDRPILGLELMLITVPTAAADLEVTADFLADIMVERMAVHLMRLGTWDLTFRLVGTLGFIRRVV